ncbi:lipase member K-like isoform X2 [Cardiocondyla obscurior]|uniref:lipase member K-like isoform X2 n=1 Tax=Cardiocondyla obscurior TaxID=286306 RepID=UPI00396574BC
MNMKLVCFIFILALESLEAKSKLEDLTSPWKEIVNYLLPENPSIVRVRNLNEVKTEINNVTTLDFIGLAKKYDYHTEEHYVTTKDGYNLVIHRLLKGPLYDVNQQKKKVVFLQHGILCSSDSWIIIGVGKDLAFLLADEGYDIWLGNVRGSSYCRSHVKLSPQSKDFWQFSFHEVGTIDLPTMIDYVLNYTMQKTVIYIGHSMGTTELFVLLSTKPEYNKKIKLGILFAPAAILKEVSPVLNFIRNEIPTIKEFFDFNDIYEIASLSSNSITIGRTLCADGTITQPICAAMTFLVVGSDPPQLNTQVLPCKHFIIFINLSLLKNFKPMIMDILVITNSTDKQRLKCTI